MDRPYSTMPPSHPGAGWIGAGCETQQQTFEKVVISPVSNTFEITPSRHRALLVSGIAPTIVWHINRP